MSTAGWQCKKNDHEVHKINPMNRRRFLKTISAGTALLALPKWLNAKDVSANRPNILFCISDDQSWQHAGDPDFLAANNGIYGEIDNLPTKLHMILHRNTPEAARLFRLAFTKRPGEELYDVRKDPYQMRNLAQDPDYTQVKKKLLKQLEQYLRDTKDPRMEGKSPWDNYPWYQGGKPRKYTK